MYPPARRAPTVTWVQQRCVPDPYRWLEDPTSAETRAWLAAEDRLIDDGRKLWATNAEYLSLLDELTSFDHLSAPRPAGTRLFFTSRRADADQPRLMVVDGGEITTLVDPSALDPTGRTVLGPWSPSPDGRWLAYQLAVGGREEFTLQVIDLETDEPTQAATPGCRYADVAWLPEGCTFFYGRLDRQGERLYLRRSDGSDVLVTGPPCGDLTQLGIRTSADGRWLCVRVSEGLGSTNAVWVADLHAGSVERPNFTKVPGLDDGWTEPWPANDGRCWMLTDSGSKHTRLVSWDMRRPSIHPFTVVAEHDQAVMESFSFLHGDAATPPALLVLWEKEGGGRLTRHRLDNGAQVCAITLPGAGAGVVSELTFRPGGGREAWLTYSDRRTPETVLRYDDSAGTLDVWQTDAGRRSDVDVWRSSFTADDGAEVGLLITAPVGRREAALPTLVEGYGAFGESQVADFYAAASAWAVMGGRHVVACVRGGGEQGEGWHRAGSRENKQRGIDDVIGAAIHLVASGLASRGRVALFGQSAGGLLMASALTQRPELFAGVACVAPLTDLVRYEQSGLGPYWREEFGSIEIAEEAEWLLSYSPYHHVQVGKDYPPVLLCSFGDDTRVDPWHAHKLCAALQLATPKGRVLLRHEVGVGHADRDRKGRLRLFADVLSFCHQTLLNNDAVVTATAVDELTRRTAVSIPERPAS
jgi:prolyl oligopeptidase